MFVAEEFTICIMYMYNIYNHYLRNNVWFAGHCVPINPEGWETIAWGAEGDEGYCRPAQGIYWNQCPRKRYIISILTWFCDLWLKVLQACFFEAIAETGQASCAMNARAIMSHVSKVQTSFCNYFIVDVTLCLTFWPPLANKTRQPRAFIVR